MVNKKSRFNRICKNIKSINIQGATNVAKAALNAYELFPNYHSKQKLLFLRPTEPLLSHVIALADKLPKNQILNHFKETQNKINDHVFKLIKNNSVIFTHCHSTNVVNALIYCKKQSKIFEVYNTETRPLYQGRKTAKELKKAGIKVTMFVDSAASIALSKEQNTKKPDLVLFGADALLKKGVVNKVGSEMFAQIARINKIPVYILADSWKYANKSVGLEQRDFHEVWPTKKIHIKNPAFEFIKKSLITGIITEYGLMSYDRFLEEIKKNN